MFCLLDFHLQQTQPSNFSEFSENLEDFGPMGDWLELLDKGA